jgi:hypothetical protein
LAANTHPIVPIEPTVPKIEYEKLDLELYSTRKRLDGLMIEVNRITIKIIS